MKVNFIRDVAARCAAMLDAAGYTNLPDTDQDVLRTYTSIRHRRIRPRPRTVQKASYTVPAHLAAGEQQLLEKVASGGDLWPHQSRKIGNVAAEDAMLNDYGIQHFHLGTTPDPKHAGLIKGTKELLFAVVQDDSFYSLGIFDHSAWSKQALLDVIQENWPHLLEPFAIKDSSHMKVLGLRHSYTDEEQAQLRKNNINVIQQRPDGTVHLGIGGGIATDGSSISATRDAMKLTDHVGGLQKQVVHELQKKVVAGDLPPEAEVRLDWRAHGPFAVTSPAAFEIDLTKALAIPPL
jgi:hypothetical protein